MGRHSIVIKSISSKVAGRQTNHDCQPKDWLSEDEMKEAEDEKGKETNIGLNIGKPELQHESCDKT